MRAVVAAIAVRTVNGSSQLPSGPVGCRPPAWPPIDGSAYASRFSPNTTWSDTTSRSTPASSIARAKSSVARQSCCGASVNVPKYSESSGLRVVIPSPDAMDVLNGPSSQPATRDYHARVISAPAADRRGCCGSSRRRRTRTRSKNSRRWCAPRRSVAPRFRNTPGRAVGDLLDVVSKVPIEPAHWHNIWTYCGQLWTSRNVPTRSNSSTATNCARGSQSCGECAVGTNRFMTS